MIPERAIAIHGHFYQPPRENPWLEAVEVQDSAAPYHDWNERVTAECYAPNTAARRVGGDDRILDIVNNFEKISFNVGPTLAAWLEREAPDVLARILEADRRSLREHGGHGNAIAQVYNHMILPLATRRDKVTQVRWAIEDFRHRFGREPEGLWLPETAVDNESLEVLAEAGIKFTILAPHQASRVRAMAPTPPEHGAWTEVHDAIDPRRAYRWRGSRGLAVFFYDASIARAIAFGDALHRGENLVGYLRGALERERAGPQLVHAATDGESYGHHTKFGDMALAAAIAQIQTAGFARLTNYGAFLAACPPTHEVEIRERTSWSCAHGVERWRADCGCRTRPDWHQRWRGPLREALDWLRDQVDLFYEARASAFLKDPWAARDAYVEVLLDRSPERLAGWLARHQRVPLDAATQVEVRRLLELQRNRLLMYTSCGWFFDDISGLEPVQVLKYAAIAIQHLRDVGGAALEEAFVHRLAAAPGNVPALPDGAEVYRRLVRPAVVDLRRVVAHYAITGLFEETPEDAPVYAYRIERLDEARAGYDVTAVRVGRVRVASQITGDTRELMYALLHFGGHDFTCGIRGFEDHAGYERMKADLLARYARHSMADMVRALDDSFPREMFSLTDLFLDGRRRVLARVIQAVLDKHEQAYHRIWEESRKLVRYLHEADARIPEVFRITAKHVLEAQIASALARVAETRAIPARAFEVADEARDLGIELDLGPTRTVLMPAVREALQALETDPTAEGVAVAVGLVRDARRLRAPFGLWHAQNRFLALWRARPDARDALALLADALGFDPAIGLGT